MPLGLRLLPLLGAHGPGRQGTRAGLRRAEFLEALGTPPPASLGPRRLMGLGLRLALAMGREGWVDEPATWRDREDLVGELVVAYPARERWAELAPIQDPFLVDRLLFAAQAGLGGCLELTVGAIRLALLGSRAGLTIDDFAQVFERTAKPRALNPFLVRDWETFARVHPGDGGAA